MTIRDIDFVESLLNRTDITHLRALNKIKHANVMDIFANTQLPFEDLDRAKFIVEEGSYHRAITYYNLPYDYWFGIIQGLYSDVCTMLGEAKRHVYSNELFTKALSVEDVGSLKAMRTLQDIDSEYFQYVLDKVVVSDKVKVCVKHCMQSKSVREAALELCVSEVECRTTCTKVAEYIRNMVDALAAYYSGDKFQAWLLSLDTHSYNIVARERCTTFEDVRVMLSSLEISGLGSTTRKHLQKSLKMSMFCA